jgi:hypothetical protein
MNKIAKIAALLVALTAAFSFSQESLSVPKEKSITCDTIHKVNSDSITLKVLKDVEIFYSNSFKDIEGSYEFFLTLIVIIVTIGCAVFGILGTWSWNQTRKNKKSLKKIRKELEKERELLEKNCKDIYGEIEYTYFSLAISSFRMKDYEEHFKNLAEHFAIFRKYKIKPEYIDSKRLTYFDGFIKEYDDKIEIAKIFLCELDKFIKYGEKTYVDINTIESKFLEDIKEKWQKLCDKFGGQDKVSEAIINFKSHL